jgi:hypothetical protein
MVKNRLNMWWKMFVCEQDTGTELCIEAKWEPFSVGKFVIPRSGGNFYAQFCDSFPRTLIRYDLDNEDSDNGDP